MKLKKYVSMYTSNTYIMNKLIVIWNQEFGSK